MEKSTLTCLSWRLTCYICFTCIYLFIYNSYTLHMYNLYIFLYMLYIQISLLDILRRAFGVCEIKLGSEKRQANALTLFLFLWPPGWRFAWQWVSFSMWKYMHWKTNKMMFSPDAQSKMFQQVFLSNSNLCATL